MTTKTVPLLPDTVPVAWDSSELIVWARLYDWRWNGFACPAFDRENTQKIVDYNNKVHAEDPNIDSFEWDGDVLVQHYGDSRYDTDEPERIEPVTDDKGVMRWAVGAWSWTWSEVWQCPHCKAAIPWEAMP
jgi:hypothetical protein